MRVAASSLVLLALALAFSLAACGARRADPRKVEGVLAYMAQCVERDDAACMYRVIDARSRHAMISIVSDRRRAREQVLASYPEDARPAALAALGDASEAPDAPGLFALRCPSACLRAIGAKLGAPTNTRVEGEETIVTTARGELRFRGGGRDWYGLVYETEALFAERERANRDLRLIEENAETYARRRALGQ